MFKKTINNKSVLIVLTVLLLIGLVACSQPKAEQPSKPAAQEPAKQAQQPPAEAKPVSIRFLAATPGGQWYPIAVGLAEIWKRNIPNFSYSVEPGGGVANVAGVHQGKGDLGITVSSTAVDGINGRAPFTEKTTNIKALLALNEAVYTMVAWADSKIRTFGDLKGKRISPAIKGYTAEAITQQVLKVYNLSYNDMAQVQFVSDEEAADLMKDGHLDAYADMGTHPDPSMTDMSTVRPIRLLTFDEDKLQELLKFNPGLKKVVIPKGTYKGMDEDAVTVGSTLMVIVSPNLPDDLVYKMAKYAAENFEKDMWPIMKSLTTVKPKDLANPVGIDYHPGAAKYYKEQGWQ